jgi:hypothetical protein
MHDQPCTGTIRDALGSGKEPDRALTPEKCQRFQPEEIRAMSLVGVAPPSRIVVFIWSGCLRSRCNYINIRLVLLVYD